MPETTAERSRAEAQEGEAMMDVDLAVRAVRSALTDGLRRAPWRGDPNPMAGHCYVASEALFHLLSDEHDVVPQCATVRGIGTHWYLRVDGRLVDATADQFQGLQRASLYAVGRGKGFLTKQPSKRAATVIDRVKGDEQ
jgi:hypothetical protein